MKQKIIPITLLTGYLGSGKTTLINYILTNQNGYKIAVIVNDIGEVNIDATLIEKGGIVSQKDENLVALSNGCICCTLKMDLVEQISDIINMKTFDYIVIEASGVCEPIPIAQTLTMMTEMSQEYKIPEVSYLDSIVAVTDALRLTKEFGCGERLLENDVDDDDIENLIIQQLEFCNVIILNKVDEISSDELSKVKQVIKKLQPDAKVIETNYCKVDISEILNTHLFDFNKAITSAGWIKELENDDDEEGETEEYGIGTYVYYRRRPFVRDKFMKFIDKEWDRSIIRSKGIVYFCDEKQMSYMFEQAGYQKNLQQCGIWLADAPEEERQQIIQSDPSILKEWDDLYGDRMNKIVFIGQNLDRDLLKKTLDDCLE